MGGVRNVFFLSVHTIPYIVSLPFCNAAQMYSKTYFQYSLIVSFPFCSAGQMYSENYFQNSLIVSFPFCSAAQMWVLQYIVEWTK